MERLTVGAMFVVAACGSSPTARDAGAIDGGVPDAVVAADAPRAVCGSAVLTGGQGDRALIVSFLEIGSADEGFDLDGDGAPDNKASAMGTLARGAIEDGLEDFELLVPMELFDYPNDGPDDCVRLAVYRGRYRFDRDDDGAASAGSGGDCNDQDPAIHPDATEVPDNGVDDNCDGLADETLEVTGTDAGDVLITVPSDDTTDADGDGVTIAAGDCDDTRPAIRGATMPEVCGDGLDNDCDGRADYGLEAGAPTCSPYDSDLSDRVLIEPASLATDGSARFTFERGVVTADTPPRLEARDGVAWIAIPVTAELELVLPLREAVLSGEIAGAGGDVSLAARLGGVMSAVDLDRLGGIEVTEIGLGPEDSLLDAYFANLLGTLLGLPKLTDGPWAGCMTPDIDVDGDGLEAFCDSDPLDAVNRVDVCVDGDGTVVFDEVAPDSTSTPCTAAADALGTPRFVDGISVELNIEAVPAALAIP